MTADYEQKLRTEMAGIIWEQIKLHLVMASIFVNVKKSSTGEINFLNCEKEWCSLGLITGYSEKHLNEETQYWISIDNQITEEVNDGSLITHTDWLLEESSAARDSNIDCSSMSESLNEDEEWVVITPDADLPIRKRKKPPHPSARTVMRQSCPNETYNWIDFGKDTCYLFENEGPVSWYEASLRCMQRGGSLAKIQSSEEFNALNQLLETSKDLPHLIHVGLHRVKQGEDAFVWLDKTQLKSTYWNEGDPGGVEENCAGLITSSLKFSSYNCQSQTASYVCSVKKDDFKGEQTDTLEESSNGVSYLTLTGICIFVFCIGTLLGYVICRYFKSCRQRRLSEKRSSVRTTYNEYNYPKVKQERETQSQALEEPVYNYPRMKPHRSTSVPVIDDQETYELMQ